MAFKMQVGASLWFNTDWTVGAKGANHRDDVMLVQQLMSLLYGDPVYGKFGSEYPDLVTTTVPDGVGPTVDGYWGPMTKAYVTEYERYMCKYFGMTVYDDVICPMRNPPGTLTHMSHVHYKLYSLHALIIVGLNYCEGSAERLWTLPHWTSAMPLRSSLMCARKEAAQYHAHPAPTPPSDGGENWAVARLLSAVDVPAGY
jgi:hypothetical protein